MKPYLIIIQALYLLSLLPWFVIWGMSFLSFDSGVNLLNISFVTSISLYPVAIIVCSSLAWLFRVKRKKFAVIMNIIPMLWMIVFAAFMSLG